MLRTHRLPLLIASTYSFINVQYLALRVIYPQLLLGTVGIQKQARQELAIVKKTIRPAQFISAIIPLVSSVLMVVVGPDRDINRSYALYQGLLLLFLGMGITGIFYGMTATRKLTETLFALAGQG